jgi:heptosyltransferase-2
MKRILVRAPNWIGDQVMAYPFFRELRKQFPQAWITVVCTPWVADVQFKGFVDEVIVIPKKKGEGVFFKLLTLLRLSRQVRSKGPWDFAISLPNSFGAALFLWLVRARVRRGYQTDLRGLLLNQKIGWDDSPDIHRADAYLRLLPHPSATDGLEYWNRSNELSFDGLVHWSRDGVPSQWIDPPSEEYFVVAPGATAESRRWSTQQFAELIHSIQSTRGWSAVVVGGPAEKRLAHEIQSCGVAVIDLTARGSVADLWRLLARAKLAVTNESGLAHVASLCGIPVHIICGAADPKRTRPIGPGPVRVTFNPVDCWPCERNLCPLEGSRHNQCLKGIKSLQVVKEIESGFIAHPRA